MRLALLFPGQGVQHPGMLPWLAGTPALAAMAARLGIDWRERLHDPAWSCANAVAQCLMTGTSLAAWETLRDALPRPVAVAGYSVGELAAFSAAGVFDVGQALDIAALRAEAMDRAARDSPGGLMAVTGPRAQVVEAVCRETGAEVAIRIDEDRVVVGAGPSALDAAEQALRRRHAELTRLAVRVASHTSAMRQAAAEVAQRLAPLPWRPPATALVVGRDGQARRSVETLKEALAEQTDHTVQWQTTLQTVAERRPDRVLEVGAGTSLSRMWRSAHPDIPVRSVDEFASAEAVVAWSLA